LIDVSEQVRNSVLPRRTYQQRRFYEDIPDFTKRMCTGHWPRQVDVDINSPQRRY
jgi:hypothetical protein